MPFLSCLGVPSGLRSTTCSTPLALSSAILVKTAGLVGSRHSPSHKPLAIWNPPESPNIRVPGSRLRTMSSDQSGLLRSRLACPPEYRLHLYGNRPLALLSQFIISISFIPAGIRVLGSTYGPLTGSRCLPM